MRPPSSCGPVAAQEIYDRAGDWVSITAPARFRWIAKHEPDVFAAIAHVGMLGDWILPHDSPASSSPTPSLGSSSGMFDSGRPRLVRTRCSSYGGLGGRHFPPVVESGTVVGAVTATAADADAGCAEGTPVVAGGADTQLGLLGIGVTRRAGSRSSAAASGSATVVLDEPLIDPRARAAHALPHRPRAVDDRRDRVLLRDRRCAGSATRSANSTTLETGSRAGVDVYDDPGASGRRPSRPARTASSASSRT